MNMDINQAGQYGFAARINHLGIGWNLDLCRRTNLLDSFPIDQNNCVLNGRIPISINQRSGANCNHIYFPLVLFSI